MNYPTCDNDCTRMGWTEALVSFPSFDMHVSHPVDTDLDSSFKAFCHDTQEMVTISGWLISEYNVV